MLEKLLIKTDLMDVLVIFVTSIAIVGIWRGVWGVMDLYIFPENSVLSFVASISFGLLILLVTAFYKSKRNKK